MRTRPSLLLIFVCTLLLCSCKSLDKTVDISLTENYVTGSFVRPTTPDKMKVYVVNEPLPLTTEVIGKFSATDPEAKRNASLDVLLDTVKKEASRFGANGLFLTDHYKPHWLGSPQHVMHGYILLQPDTILKPDREHPLNTAIREHLEREEAKKLAEKEELKRLYPPHRFYLSAGYSNLIQPKDAEGTYRSELTNGLNLQASYTYNGYGILYSGRYVNCDALQSNSHSIIPIFLSINTAHKNEKLFMSMVYGIGCQWENVFLKSPSTEAVQHISGRRAVIYGAIEYEYRIRQHWGLATRFHVHDWGVTKRNDYQDKVTAKCTEYGISLGINYHF